MKIFRFVSSVLSINCDRKAIWGIFWIIYLTSSHAISCNAYSPLVSYAVFLLAFLNTFSFRSKIKTNCLLYGLLFVTLMGVTTLVNTEDIRPFVLVSASLLLGAYYTAKVPLTVFRDALIYVMSVLCLISLFFYPLYIFIPQLQEFNVVGGSDQVPASSFLVFTSHDVLRNQSIFWEPGAFQTYICLATFFELTKSNFNKNRIWLFIITCITTLSTTGYCGMFLLLPWYLMKKRVSLKSYIVVSAVLLIVSFLGVTYFSDLLFSTSDSSVFGKLIVARNSDGFSEGDLTTASVRYFSVVKPIGVFLDNPLFGVGYQGLKTILYNYTFNMNTCTFVNYFAVYGIVLGSLALYGYWNLVKIFEGRKVLMYLLFFFIFLITFSEDYVNFSFFYILIIYGLSNSSYSKGSL